MDPSRLHAIGPGRTTARRYAALAGIGQKEARAELESLAESGIGRRDGGAYLFGESDRLSAGLAMIERGEPAGPVAEALDWRAFEELAARVLESRGFETERNVVLRGPRAQIDVAAVRGGVALVVDCKHWTGPSGSRAARAARMQERRARQYARARSVPAVPAVVVLRPEDGRPGRIPVVPIAQLGGFADELPGRLDEVACASPDQDGG